MGLELKHSAELTVAVISPFDVWSAGVEQMTAMRGWRFAGRLPCGPEGVGPDPISQLGCIADVLLVANRLLARHEGGSRRRPFVPVRRRGLVAVIEPGECFTMEDFLTLEVEGMVLSTAGFDDLGHCIESVGAGGRWIDPGIRELLGSDSREAETHPLLSDRERQVAWLAAEGLSNKAIARELGVSDGTIKMHMHHVLGKLGLDSRFNLRGLEWLRRINGTAGKHAATNVPNEEVKSTTFF